MKHRGHDAASAFGVDAFLGLILGGCALAFSGCASTSRSLPSKAADGEGAALSSASEAAADFRDEANALKADGATERWDEVAERMGRVTEDHPDYGLAWYNLGVAREKLDEPTLAAEAYRRAIAADGSLREARENLAALAARRGDEREAVTLLRELVARDAGAAEARVALASRHLAANEPDEARRLCVEALTHDPKNLGAYCVLGEAAWSANNHQRVRLLAAQGLKIDPEAACLHQLLGRLAQKQGDPGAALAHFERAVKSDSEAVEPWFRIGQISMAYRDFERATEAFGKVTVARPADPAAFVNLGVAHKGLGRIEAAEQAYLAAIQAAQVGDVPAAHYNLGVLYLRHLDRLDDAERSLKTYLKVADGDAKEVFAWLEEIDTRRRIAEEDRLAAQEAARQAEIERMQAEEESRQKAALEAKIAAENARARAAGEPMDPAALGGPAPETSTAEAEPAERPAEASTKRKSAPKRRRSSPSQTAPDETEPIDPPGDFE